MHPTAIRTEVILRLRDHLLESAKRASRQSLSAGEFADAVLRRIEPFAELMHAVMVADAMLHPAERTVLRAALDILCDGAVGGDELDALIHRFESREAPIEPEDRVAAAAARIGHEREDRETALLLAAAIALADDAYESGEQRVLAWTRTYLGISERRMASLLNPDQP